MDGEWHSLVSFMRINHDHLGLLVNSFTCSLPCIMCIHITARCLRLSSQQYICMWMTCECVGNVVIPGNRTMNTSDTLLTLNSSEWTVVQWNDWISPLSNITYQLDAKIHVSIFFHSIYLSIYLSI